VTGNLRADIEALDLDAIRARVDAATEGPWEASHEFAAHARTDIPALLAEVERLRAERDAAHEHLAYHLRDFRPGLDDKATGDLAVDMAAYAGRLKAEVDRLRAILDAHPAEESAGEVRMSVTREQWATAVDAAEESIAGDDRVTTRFPRSVAFNTLGDAFAALGVTVTGEEADR